MSRTPDCVHCTASCGLGFRENGGETVNSGKRADYRIGAGNVRERARSVRLCPSTTSVVFGNNDESVNTSIDCRVKINPKSMEVLTDSALVSLSW